MSVLLLDTCALVWWMADAPELSRAARLAISDPRTTVLVSVASLWEIAIKTRKGRLIGMEEVLARHQESHQAWGFSTVLIEASDAVAAGALAIRHDDPFDRTLIVQARRLEAAISSGWRRRRIHSPSTCRSTLRRKRPRRCSKT